MLVNHLRMLLCLHKLLNSNDTKALVAFFCFFRLRMIVFLLPPSEGKALWGLCSTEVCSFSFEKPTNIAQSVTEKDIKCTWVRYQQAMELHQSLDSGPYMKAIDRYTGVMYKAIGYHQMSSNAQQYFDEHVLILSGYYGALKPYDCIVNYKLPITAKWLYAFWSKRVTRVLEDATLVVDLLPWAYKKMIDFWMLRAAWKEVLQVDFFAKKWTERKKLTHGVKKVKGQWLQKVSSLWCTTSEAIQQVSLSSDILLRFW